MRAFFVISLFVLTLSFCTTKSKMVDFNSKKIQIYYIQKSNSQLSFSIQQSSLPVTTENSQFSYYFKINKRNSTQTFTDYRRTNYLYSNDQFISGDIQLPWELKESDTLDIYLYGNSSNLLNTKTLIIEDLSIEFKVLSKNKTYNWQAPYIIIGVNYIIKSQYDNLNSVVYKIDFENQNSILSKTEINNCSSNCLYTPNNNGYLKILNSETDSLIYKCPIVSKTFPKNNTPAEMIKSFTLINSTLNADSLYTTTNGAKIELDKIWLEAADNNEINAKKAILNYYTRIEEANKMFTNYCSEGMYSDKGKSLILFGKPLYNISLDSIEKWYYTKDTSDYSKCIEFVKNNNECNDFNVVKNDVYNIRYEQALLHWQKAKVFTLYLQ